MGKGSTTIQAPPQISAAEAKGEYLFGPNFGSFEGVTDPRLQQRLLGAESAGRQAYTGLELRDIGTMARGIEDPKQTAEYKRLQTELAGLQSGKGVSDSEAAKLARAAAGPKPQKTITVKYRGRGGGTREQKNPNYEKELKAYNAEISKLTKSLGGNRKAQASQIKAQMRGLEKAGGTPGLFDLLEESSVRAADLQRQQLGQQRRDDVAALQRFAPQVVQAYRDADPESTRLAEMASARAGRDTGLGARGRGLLGSRVQSASAAERQLQEMGMTLGDLSPTEQEALISGRGTEFIQSTGELSPLEQRRAQQSSRQASLARGREMGQGSLYDEMLARQSEELNKQERQVALGSQLLGQEAGMRGARLGQGAGMLQGSEALQSGRFGQAFGMNRQLAGDVGMTILGRPSSAIQIGQNTLRQSQAGAAGPMGPQLFDPNVGINMALQNQQNQFGLLGAQAQADATRSAGGLGAFGSIVGGFLGGR